MERPSKDALIRHFLGKSYPVEEKAVELFLAMKVEDEFVEGCLKEAFYLQDDSELGNVDIAREVVWSRLIAKQQEVLDLYDPPLQHQRQQWGRSWMQFAAAAAVIILVTTFTLVNYKKNDRYFAEQVGLKGDILPGEDKASLILSDGSVISLSDVDEGLIIAEGGVQVEKTAEGEIVYRGNNQKANVRNAFNTVSTPNGGQFRVTLPDGSKAWLNAASSLSYPVSFESKERRVKMTGEVYFEVAKQEHLFDGKRKHVPFFVETDKQLVQVLGTQFSVNAYRDEPSILTTLVEGSVRVISHNGHSVVLRPGQQADVTDRIVVSKADMEQQLAWKNGDFVFKKERLSSVLRKVSRWYDIEVECPPNLDVQLSGMVSRSQSLSAVIESMSSLGAVNLVLKERRIIVTK